MVDRISEILEQRHKPALLIGNGINQFNNYTSSSWAKLLGRLSSANGLKLSTLEMKEMSNTEFFDILDLAKSKDDRSNLQRQFCDLMSSWRPSDQHSRIVSWAQNHCLPIVTVNFDENLSRSVGAEYFVGERFTDWYPWSSYFSDRKIVDPKNSFAIWHAHGMMRYSRSIRLGLTHYMGAVQRARSWVYHGRESLRTLASREDGQWQGNKTWLDVLFFSPLMIFGFGFNKDESFLRWLFLERARLHKINPSWKVKTWFVDTPRTSSLHRKAFFEGLGMKYVAVADYNDIYENPAWLT